MYMIHTTIPLKIYEVISYFQGNSRRYISNQMFLIIEMALCVLSVLA